MQGHRRRPGQQQQGNVATRDERVSACPVGERHRRSRVRDAFGRRHGGALVRALAIGCRARARGDGPGGPPCSGHREAREARSRRQSRSRGVGLRRGDGCPWRSRCRAAVGRGAAGSEAGHPNGKGERQTRHRGDPDARVDDRALTTDQGRGLRRRQRRTRRCRCGDAVLARRRSASIRWPPSRPWPESSVPWKRIRPPRRR